MKKSKKQPDSKPGLIIKPKTSGNTTRIQHTTKRPREVKPKR